VLNKAKVNYKSDIASQVSQLPSFTKVALTYKLFPQSKRRTDLGNVIAIHQKFFEDALVELGKIPDDDYKHVVKITQLFGKVDKDNPRIEISIEEIL